MNQDIFFQLSLTAIAFLPSILLWSVGKEKYALYALLLAALVLRLVITSLDPYLNEWDERFHAVVAKNMMQYPLKPMIRLEPWCLTGSTTGAVIIFGFINNRCFYGRWPFP